MYHNIFSATPSDSDTADIWLYITILCVPTNWIILLSLNSLIHC